MEVRTGNYVLTLWYPPGSRLPEDYAGVLPGVLKIFEHQVPRFSDYMNLQGVVDYRIGEWGQFILIFDEAISFHDASLALMRLENECWRSGKQRGGSNDLSNLY